MTYNPRPKDPDLTDELDREESPDLGGINWLLKRVTKADDDE